MRPHSIAPVFEDTINAVSTKFPTPVAKDEVYNFALSVLRQAADKGSDDAVTALRESGEDGDPADNVISLRNGRRCEKVLKGDDRK